jgi:hypothetical protein
MVRLLGIRLRPRLALVAQAIAFLHESLGAILIYRNAIEHKKTGRPIERPVFY